MSNEDPKMTLVKIGAGYCPPCKSMERLKTCEKFTAAHPNVTYDRIEIADHEGTDDQKELKRAMKLHKKLAKTLDGFEAEISNIPVVLFLDEHGEVLAGDTGGHSLKMLESLYDRALQVYEENQDSPAGDDDQEEDDQDEEDGEED